MQYVFSLLKSTFRLHNLGMLFFMLLNCLVLFWPLASTVGTDAGIPALALAVFILCSAVYYALVLAVGAVFIRLMFGGNQVVIGSDTSPLAIAFAEAYAAAKEQDPTLSDNIKLYGCSIQYPDAFAFGRSTILISPAAAEMPQNQLRALLLEKFAQISNHDSDRIQFLIAGNLAFVAAILLVKVAVYVAVAMLSLILSIMRGIVSLLTRVPSGLGFGLLNFSAYLNVCRILSDAIEAILLFLLNLVIRVALLSAASNYYINDQFVCRCGFSADLRNYLQYSVPHISGYRSTLATISAARPSPMARIARLNDIPAPVSPSGPIPFPGGREPEPPISAPSRPAFRVLSRSQNVQPPTGSTAENKHFHVVSRDDNT